MGEWLLRAMNSLPNNHDSLEKVKISEIKLPEKHIRSQVSDERVEEISNSIEEEGLIEPIEVTQKGDRFEVVIGRIRLLALRNTKGVDKVPVKIVDVSGMEKVERQLASNTARAEMNTMDKIEGAGKLSNHLESSEEPENSDGRGPDGVNSLLADKLGVSKNTITKWMRVYNEASDKQKEKLKNDETSLTSLNEELKDTASSGIGGQEEGNDGGDDKGKGSNKPPANQVNSGITSIKNVETDSLPDEDKEEIAERFEDELWDVYCDLRGRDKAREFFEQKVDDLRGDEDGPK